MIRNCILLKSFAVFCAIEILSSTIFPAVSYALTAGPTSPEATSFEPVDVSEMVDLKSGDFTYNLPLLEVPGPAGSYPLSLSYHAGIYPDVEASWVGLGFSLNPGAITRLVNGFPDDHYLVGNTTHEFWEGDEREQVTVGLSVGLGNVASVSADLVYAQDSYKGSGIGLTTGISGGVTTLNGENSPFSVSANIGVGPYGESASSISLSVGVGGDIAETLSHQYGLGLSINGSGSVSQFASAGVSVGRTSLVGASISSNGGGVRAQSDLYSSFSIHQNRVGKVSSFANGWQVEIPVWYMVNLRLGRSYQRQWIDEKENVFAYGSLYHGLGTPSFNVAFDTYDLLDPNLDIAANPNPEKVLGGSFPDIDSYTVTGQGIGGMIEPVLFKQELYRQNKKNKNNVNLVVTSTLGAISQDGHQEPQFRFVGDFSNRYEYTPTDFISTISPTGELAPQLSYQFNGTTVTGDGQDDDGIEGNYLIGSRHIEWFTNKAIQGGDPNKVPKSYGFIDTRSEGFARLNNHQVGGFSITNSSGVTYHYALPAYSYDEVMKYQNTKKQAETNRKYYNEVKKPERYAHTWHLTAVTGPDYIDRNNNGLADKGDWGYWVTYEYKKWCDDYKWRNPARGFNKDIDNDFDFYSGGKKEIYHLRRIITESHVAVFNCSERLDSREVANIEEGGFSPVSDGSSLDIPTSGFKLDAIDLFSYDDYAAGRLSAGNILRSIKFNYGYTLCKNTPNSYEFPDYMLKRGKLTLLSVEFLGKGKISGAIPPVKFGYAYNPDYEADVSTGDVKTDMWGYYKSDYVGSDNKNISKATTEESASNVDAWSLTKITTSLGAEINIEYESDHYRTPGYYNRNLLTITKLEPIIERGTVRVTFDAPSFNMENIFGFVDALRVELLLDRQLGIYDAYCTCNYDGGDPETWTEGIYFGSYYDIKSAEITLNNVVGAPTATTIEFEDDELYAFLNKEEPIAVYELDDKTYCDGKRKGGYNSFTGNPNVFILRPEMRAGNIVIPGNLPMHGGGLRVKSISTISNGNTLLTEYEYGDGVTTYEPITFGKVNVKLVAEDNFVATWWTPEKNRRRDAKLSYNMRLFRHFASVLGVAREIPGPGVMYKTVTVRQKSVTADGVPHPFSNYLVYHFETFEQGMINVNPMPFTPSPVDETPASESDVSMINKRTVVIKDYTSRIGNLKSVETYAEGTDELIARTENEYLHNYEASFEQNRDVFEPAVAQQFRGQGILEKTYVSARKVRYEKDEVNPYYRQVDGWRFKQNTTHLLGVISKQESFPNILWKIRSKNYRTGVTKEERNLMFDFYSGAVTASLTTDSYGNNYLSTSVPAYTHYDEMKSKAYDPLNKNMLIQNAEEYSFLVDDNGNKLGLLSAGIQTWRKLSDVTGGTIIGGSRLWSKHKTFVWNGDHDLDPNTGIYPYSEFAAFDWSPNAQNDHWLETNELTKTDIYSHALEGKDVNGLYSSVKMDNNYYRVIATASNASYNEIAFSGAEDFTGSGDSEGGVNRGQGLQSQAHVHSGENSLLVKSGTTGFTVSLSNNAADLSKKYAASVWVYAPGFGETQAELDKVELYASIDGAEYRTSPTLNKSKSKNWYLMTLDIPANNANNILVTVKNNGARDVYFDDFRIHPFNAIVTSYVYDSKSGELTYLLDANNFYTRFEYDAFGRLLRTSKELLNFDFGPGKESYRADAVLGEYKYNYGKNNAND